MGLFDFASNIGKKIFGGDDDPAEKLQEHIAADNPGINDLNVSVEDGVASISGDAASAEALEKTILMAGNAKGIETVNVDAATVEGSAPALASEDEFYVIESGDTLWKIAANAYGNGAKYTAIFEANKEVITDPDKIFPGQKIRIPKGL